MKDPAQILALNAFDPASASALDSAALGPELTASVQRRSRVFGAASVLFYDRPLNFVRGEGCWLYDADGLAYLDAYNNVPSVGHCHPRVTQAAARQLDALNIHNRYLHHGTIDYAERLTASLPPSLSNVTFTCTGSESNDLALRLAATFTGANGVIVTESAYHGNTALVTQVSPTLIKGASSEPFVRRIPPPDSYRVPAADMAPTFAAHVSAAIADLASVGAGISALLVDSIFSSDGVFADPPGFMRAAIEAVHQAGGLFIADEVQCGFARTGTSLWGFERHGVFPDIVTLGKPMGNGYPMGAVVTRPDILDAFCAEYGYFNTFAGSPVAAAIGQAVLDVIDEDGLMDNARRVGEHLRRSLESLAARHAVIADVRGAGLYIGVELRELGAGSSSAPHAPGLVKSVLNGMRQRRVLIGAAGSRGTVLKIRPPLCFSTVNADQLVAALDDTLRHG